MAPTYLAPSSLSLNNWVDNDASGDDEMAVIMATLPKDIFYPEEPLLSMDDDSFPCLTSSKFTLCATTT